MYIVSVNIVLFDYPLILTDDWDKLRDNRIISYMWAIYQLDFISITAMHNTTVDFWWWVAYTCMYYSTLSVQFCNNNGIVEYNPLAVKTLILYKAAIIRNVISKYIEIFHTYTCTFEQVTIRQGIMISRSIHISQINRRLFDHSPILLWRTRDHTINYWPVLILLDLIREEDGVP